MCITRSTGCFGIMHTVIWFWPINKQFLFWCGIVHWFIIIFCLCWHEITISKCWPENYYISKLFDIASHACGLRQEGHPVVKRRSNTLH